MTRHGLVDQMPMGEIAAGLGERAEIRKRLHGRDAREFLARVSAHQVFNVAVHNTAGFVG